MKKIILLTLFFALGCLVLVGCSNNNDPFVQKEYIADVSQIQKIGIDVRDRQIEVSISEDNQIHIVYSENSKETYDITVSDENILTMASASNKDWIDYIGGKPSAENRKISLQIPDTFLDSIVLSTTNENISLQTMAVIGSISLSSNGGCITFENLNVGNSLTLTVKNGDIRGTIIGNYDDFAIQSEVKKGKSNLPDNKKAGERTLSVSGNNGDVDIEFVNK